MSERYRCQFVKPRGRQCGANSVSWSDYCMKHDEMLEHIAEKENELCAAQLYPETRIDPAEHCDDDAVPGSDYCERHAHLGGDIWDAADAAHDRLRDELAGI